MFKVTEKKKKKNQTLLNHYEHHLLWSGWEVGQSLADMKMWLAPAVSSAWVPVVDTCLRRHLWEGLTLRGGERHICGPKYCRRGSVIDRRSNLGVGGE